MAREKTKHSEGGPGRKPLLNEQDCALLREHVRSHPGTPMVELVRLLEARERRPVA